LNKILQKKLSIFLTIITVLYFASGYVFAASGESLSGIDLTANDVIDIINGLACWAMRVAGAVMVIFLVLAGLRFMNAQGDTTKWATAKKNFNHVLIGIVVIMGTYVIIATVANAVGADFSFIPLVC